MATIHEITEDWQREGLSPTWVKLQKAQAEFDALAADAARYRWLRERVTVWLTNNGIGPVSWCLVTKVPASSMTQDETDAAIDAAMKGE